MSEENINYVMEYIQSNPNQTTESLVKSLITAGYSPDDIRIALGRLGLSPLAMPGSNLQPIEEPVKRALFKNLLALCGAALILITIYYLGNTNLARYLQTIPFIGRKPQLSQPVTEIAEIPEEIKIENAPDANDQIAKFRDAYENGTFKLTLSSNSMKDIESTSLDLVYYTENGYIDRFDNPGGISTIVRTNAYYTIDNNSKTFTKVDSTDFRYGLMVQTLHDSFILKELIMGLDSDKLKWEKINSSSWKVQYTDSSTFLMITFDEVGFPSSIVIHGEDGMPAQQYDFIFEPIIITEELLTVPKGYKEVEQIEGL